MTRIEANLLDIHNRNIYPAEIELKNGKIFSINASDKTYSNYILPGFIDAHVHIESSLLIPSSFARAAIPHGTIATVSDPHEIANVCGIPGIEFMIKNGSEVPFHFYFGAPSCVPATAFETNGANISAADINTLFEQYKLCYLSEVMNYPAVINEDAETLKKISIAKRYNKRIDGHAPQLSGEMLRQYVKSGIDTDHECSTLEEAIEKISLGMKILIREGSAAKNFETLAPLIDLYPEMVMLCSDDLHADSLSQGHINLLIQKGLALGLDLFNLIRAATINPILHYNLEIGTLQLNDPADFIIVNNLRNFETEQCWIKGELVYNKGKLLFPVPNVVPINNFKLKPINREQLKVPAKGRKIRIIHLKEDELLTGQSIENARIINHELISDPERDLLKLVVISRYSEYPAPAIAFIKNFGLSSGAIASTVGHDSHNVIAVGNSDSDLCIAINLVINSKGGLSAVHNGKSEILPLPFAGLMTDDSASSVSEKLEKLNTLALKSGCKLKAPFMALSFLSLIVIPHLKLSDKGLFDVDSFSFTDLFVDEHE